jgi:enoyl-CoA hydratase/carnithine racemase
MPTPKKKPAAKIAAKAADALFVRDAELVEALDAWAAKLNAASPDGLQWNRAALARAAIKRALRERGEKGEGP